MNFNLYQRCSDVSILKDKILFQFSCRENHKKSQDKLFQVKIQIQKNLFIAMGNGRSAIRDCKHYREGYPGLEDDTQRSRNLEFYSNKIHSIPDGSQRLIFSQ